MKHDGRQLPSLKMSNTGSLSYTYTYTETEPQTQTHRHKVWNFA